jgi:signal peptidase I
MKRFLLNVWEVAEVVLIALVTVFFIRSFVVQPFLVSGASMEPTFSSGNYLLIDEITYRFREPQRGETVVFRYPGDITSFFIKRIIGLPGEMIEIRDNIVTITNPNGEQETLTIEEPYIKPETKTIGEKTTALGADEYYVLGDNRGNSFDSRNWGPLDKDDIIGVVRIRIFPFNKFGTLNTPIY